MCGSVCIAPKDTVLILFLKFTLREMRPTSHAALQRKYQYIRKHIDVQIYAYIYICIQKVYI